MKLCWSNRKMRQKGGTMFRIGVDTNPRQLLIHDCNSCALTYAYELATHLHFPYLCRWSFTKYRPLRLSKTAHWVFCRPFDLKRFWNAARHDSFVKNIVSYLVWWSFCSCRSCDFRAKRFVSSIPITQENYVNYKCAPMGLDDGFFLLDAPLHCATQ